MRKEWKGNAAFLTSVLARSEVAFSVPQIFSTVGQCMIFLLVNE